MLSPGTVFSHTYDIEQLLASGGMGEVYRARHIELGTEHAIKLILPELAQDPTIIRMFIEEARQLGHVVNDAIVQYQGFLRDEHGWRFLVMEFVDGESLVAILQRRRFDEAEVLGLLDRLGQGLRAVHEQGIIHRDISPQNIILPGGRVERAKLIDFGIAKSADPSAVTLIGTDFAGKYSFASPEQVGLFAETVDQRSDIYSLALVLAAAALGFGNKLDMGGTPAAVIQARQRVPDLSSLPAGLRPLLEHMLQPDPANRPPSVPAVLEEARSRLISVRKPAQPRAQRVRRPALWLAALGFGVAIAVLAAIFAFSQRPPSVKELRVALADATSRYRCADLSYTVTPERAVKISGFAANIAEIAELNRAVAALPGVRAISFDVRPRIWPYCEAFAMLKPLLASSETRVPRLALASSDREAHLGSPLLLDITGPAFDGYLYVDYFSSTGEVLHLFPNNRDPINLRPARNSFFLGKPPMRGCWVLAGDTGEQLVTAVFSAMPMFPAARPENEDATVYLSALSQALANGSPHQQAAGALFFDLQRPKTAQASEDPCVSR